MAGVQIRIDMGALPEAGRRLQEVLRGDRTPLMDEIGASLVTSTQQRFEDGVGPDGQSWPESYRASTEGGQTLVDHSHLRDSVTHAPSARDVAIGSNLIYAGVHQEGAVIRAKGPKALRFQIGGRWATKRQVTIPARPFLGISGADRAEIGAILQDHLRAGLDRGMP
jgi:phage virion morphogenesis protein